MAEMNRNRDQQNQGSNRQSDQGMGGNRDRDMQGGRDRQSTQQQWDGTERRTGGERRSDYTTMEMNEGSSR